MQWYYRIAQIPHEDLDLDHLIIIIIKFQKGCNRKLKGENTRGLQRGIWIGTLKGEQGIRRRWISIERRLLH